MLYSNDPSFLAYYDYYFPSDTPQTKCASKPTETEETITIDVDAFDICFVDFSVELIDYDSDDDTIEDDNPFTLLFELFLMNEEDE